MSNALAIASVTAVLKDLLNNGLIDHDVTGILQGNVTVSTLPPDRVDVAPLKEQSQLNLFMYRVTRNQGYAGGGLPSRDSRGERVANPPLALDLHYLLTAYGADELHSEVLLGYGMLLLHETPVLDRAAIRRSLAPPRSVAGIGLPGHLSSLTACQLAEQIELVTLSPEALTPEDMSKLWTAFQAKYRPTAAYQATVVLIESDKSTRSALPVRERRGYAASFERPLIKQIRADKEKHSPDELQPALCTGDILVILGESLRGEHTRMLVGGLEAVPQEPEDLTDTEIRVPVPEGLRAGVQSVQVVHCRDLGPPHLRPAVASNLVAFVLRPQLGVQITSDVRDRRDGLCSGDLSLRVTPAVQPGQRVVVLLNEFIEDSSPPASPPVEPAAYGFPISPVVAGSPPAPMQDLTVPFREVKAGTYLVRISVDGAESSLEFGNGRYRRPNVEIS